MDKPYMKIGKNRLAPPSWRAKIAPFQGTFTFHGRQNTRWDPLRKKKPRYSVFIELFFSHKNICINTTIVPDPKKQRSAVQI